MTKAKKIVPAKAEAQEMTLGLIELASIATGFLTADAMVKKAPVRMLLADYRSPGKFIILVTGDVASVDEAMKEGLDVGRLDLLDSLFLPNAHAHLAAVLAGPVQVAALGSLGVIETYSIASCLLAADAAAKAADVVLLEMRLGNQLGGKGYFTMTGEQYAVEAALDAADQVITRREMLYKRVLIAQPHEDMYPRFKP